MRIKFINSKLKDAPTYTGEGIIERNKEYHEDEFYVADSMDEVIKTVKRAIDMNKPVLLLGPTGFSKTATGIEIAQAIGREYIDVRLGSYLVEDLKGLPSIEVLHNNKGDSVNGTKYSVPDFVKPIVINPEGKYLIGFDEITHAMPDVLNVFMQIIYERKLGNFKFPEDVRFMAMGNAKSEVAANAMLEIPLIRRFPFRIWMYEAALKSPEYFNEYLRKKYAPKFVGFERLLSALLDVDWDIKRPADMESVLEIIYESIKQKDANLLRIIKTYMTEGQYTKFNRIYNDEKVKFKEQTAASKRKQQMVDIKDYINKQFAAKLWQLPESAKPTGRIPLAQMVKDMPDDETGQIARQPVKLTKQQIAEIQQKFPDINAEINQALTESEW